MSTTISFIGAGNMATSLINGLITDGFDAKQIWASNLLQEKLHELKQQFKIHVSENNIDAAKHGDVIVLSVKPQLLKEVCLELAETIQKNKPLIISIAAGVREEDIARWLGGKIAIVRCMPNTPALINCGATALYANAWVNTEQKNLAESILRAVGITVWLEEEKLLDTVTAVSGSGPAYFFLLIEAMEKAAQNLGLPPKAAHLLITQTALGAARMVMESNQTPSDLRKQVTSPGGTTESAITYLEKHDMVTLLENAVRAAEQRADELASLFGK